jgi:hypothetical protein
MVHKFYTREFSKCKVEVVEKWLVFCQPYCPKLPGHQGKWAGILLNMYRTHKTPYSTASLAYSPHINFLVKILSIDIIFCLKSFFVKDLVAILWNRSGLDPNPGGQN